MSYAVASRPLTGVALGVPLGLEVGLQRHRQGRYGLPVDHQAVGRGCRVARDNGVQRNARPCNRALVMAPLVMVSDTTLGLADLVFGSLETSSGTTNMSTTLRHSTPLAAASPNATASPVRWAASTSSTSSISIPSLTL